MKRHLQVVFLLAAMSMSSVASARTWRVELDGSGDYTDIQPAVDAAAPGDTIRIGPGRFDTFHPITAPAWTEDTIVGVLKDALTFIGSGQNVTFLGPTTYVGAPGDNPKVFCSFGGFDGRIENMTIENVEAGVFWERGTLTVNSCVFRAADPNYFALQLLTDDCVVQDCSFEHSDGGTAIIISSLGNVHSCQISDCSIQGARYGVRVGYGAQGISIRNTSIDAAYWGVVLDQSSIGLVESCSITNTQDVSALILNGSQVTLLDSKFDGGSYGLDVNGGIAIGTGIVVSNTTITALYLNGTGQATIHGSHILPAAGLAFKSSVYAGTPALIDLTGNYWGTTDSAAIAASIHDSQDDPALHCTVLYEPFANGPVPAESTSWGDLKALFR